MRRKIKVFSNASTAINQQNESICVIWPSLVSNQNSIDLKDGARKHSIVQKEQ